MIDRLLRPLLGREERVAGVPEGVAIVRGRLIPRLGGVLAGTRGPAAAVTLGRTIVVDEGVELTERLLRHELEHVRQWRESPIGFPLLYVWNHLRFGYRDNPYEVEARAAETQS
jgi:hypothetical protein